MGLQVEDLILAAGHGSDYLWTFYSEALDSQKQNEGDNKGTAQCVFHIKVRNF